MSEDSVDKPNEYTIFEDKSFNDLMQDIYSNSNEKKAQIERMISVLAPLVTSVNSAEILAPIIKELFDVSVKNDEQLVKLASVIQRHIATFNKTLKSSAGDEFSLTEEEKRQLLDAALEDELKHLANSN